MANNGIGSKLVRVGIAGFLCLLAIAASAQSASNLAERRYQLADRGYLVLSVPAGWREQVHRPDAKMPPTITFRSSSQQSFDVLVTPIWPLKSDAPPPTLDELKGNVLRAAKELGPQAVEKILDAVQLEGPYARGYFFKATDRAPKPGEYKNVTQGTVAVGNVRVTFTILTNDGQSKVVTSALGMLRGARLATP